jgi:methylenetetrahydrofolate dehydrogenase (NADP+) / methenyltetrahydrofolate cyclohydrolase
MKVLSGRELAAEIRAGTAAAAAALAATHRPPRLTVVTATDDEASAWYVRSLASAAAKAGIGCEVEDLGPQATADGITVQLAALSADPTVHGIILTTPLPGGARLAELAGAIDPAKDVDGANPVSLGRLMTGLPTFAPATAEAALSLLDHYQVELAGRHAVVVGRSAVVGKPVAHLLLDRNATVTICHSRTPDLAAITTQADVLVVAVGRAGLIGPGHVAPGATVVDVGTNATPDGGLAGDVDPKVADVAGALSPVPGGVGPVTTALLLRHVTDATASPTPPRADARLPWVGVVFGVIFRGEQVQERAHPEPLLGGVAEQAVAVHGVPGASAGPGAREVAGGLQVGHDGLDGPVGEPDDGADVADPGLGAAGDLHEHVAVPGQERPAAAARVRVGHAT